MTISYDFEDCRASWSYKELLGPNQVLYGEFVRYFNRSLVNPISKPLGTIYDESSNKWVVADSGNNALRLFGTDFKTGDMVTSANLKIPSALAIWNPGRHISVLDENSIRIFDQQSGTFITIANVNHCRGLGVTNSGEFVTIQYSRLGSEILFYSTKMPNKVIAKNSYLGNSLSKPSFLDISKDKVCVTDLGVNGFSIYNLNPDTLSMELIKQEISSRERDEEFLFVSGVKFDRNNELLIADALGYKLQYFDKSGRFLHRVKFSDPFLYASNFSLNSHHQLLACDRNNGTLKLYQMKGMDPDQLSGKQTMPELNRQASRNFNSELSGDNRRDRYT